MSSFICTRCRRGLKNPEAIKRGMGSVCWRKSGGNVNETPDMPADTLLTPFTGDIVLKRRPDGVKEMNVMQVIIRHSPTGLEWGYAGSGPADMALNILYLFTKNKLFSERCHQDFKFQFVAAVPREGGVIPGAKIKDWISNRVLALADEMMDNYQAQLMINEDGTIVNLSELKS